MNELIKFKQQKQHRNYYLKLKEKIAQENAYTPLFYVLIVCWCAILFMILYNPVQRPPITIIPAVMFTAILFIVPTGFNISTKIRSLSLDIFNTYTNTKSELEYLYNIYIK